MVQGSDFSALSAWCRTAKKRKSRPAAKSKPPTSPVLNPPLYAEADGAPRGGAGRKKRVRFAMNPCVAVGRPRLPEQLELRSTLRCPSALQR
eukprot:GGOE01003330.1.p1 GENE.GGOE01003330.1~~GGOE01003330.1.p1  ORF type:complete len:102 (-),score=10.78 GGOE01003330.1:774-1049(-)